MTTQEFIQKYLGQHVEAVDPTNLNQCFDLAVQYCIDVLGLQNSIFNGNLLATQIFTNPTELAKKNFDFITNAPENIPNEGDIVVFGKGINHVVVASKGSTAQVLQCFSQNDPLFSACILKEYDYSHVLGWLHFNPKMEVSQALYSQLVANSTAYDYVCDAFKIPRNSGLDRVTEAISTRSEQLLALEKAVADEHRLNNDLVEKIKLLTPPPTVVPPKPEEKPPVSEPIVVTEPQADIPPQSIPESISLSYVIFYYMKKLLSFLGAILKVQLPKQ